MSIWSSVQGTPVKAIINDGDNANYTGEGAECLVVDVATATSFHDRVRLAVWGDQSVPHGVVDVDVLLPPAAVRELIRKLREAVGDDACPHCRPGFSFSGPHTHDRLG